MISNKQLKQVINGIKFRYNIKTQKEIASKLGYNSATYISDMISGKSKITEVFLSRLQEQFNINPQFILSGEGEIWLPKKEIIMNIKHAREKLNISQEKLANLIGVHPRTVQNWEAGKTIPKSKLIILKHIFNKEMKEESSIKQRTLEFIKYKGIKMKTFEEQCNLSSGYVTSMRKGFGSDKLNNVLSAFPELNRNWLLYGEGEMINNIEHINVLQRIKECINHLKDNGIIHTQQNIVDMMQRNKSSVSRALSGDPLYLTNDFIDAFVKTFRIFNINWIRLGEGDMLTDKSNSINSTNVVEKLISLLEKKDEQMDRLIGLLEKK
jgi:transcriptional regulator with XRE-family HTH domain